MAGYGRVVVGYREDDRRRYRLADEQGYAMRSDKCVSCGAQTFFVPSGADAIRTRDAAVVCDNCYQDNKHLMDAIL